MQLPAPKKMSPAAGKCSKIRHIVRIRQMLVRWRNKARMTAGRGAPSDVPAGHVAVCVGPSCKRFIVRATYLNHPIFKKLLIEAEEEYGFSNQGPLTIPCDESVFEEILRLINQDLQRRCHLNVTSTFDLIAESTPLLRDQPIY